MVNNKAIKILSTFSSEEQKRFYDFVNSPFHNKNNKLIQLIDLLKDYHPSYEFDPGLVQKRIYPDSKTGKNNMKKLMSELLRVCESFLKCLRLEDESFQSEIILIKEFEQRKLDSLCSLYLNRIDKDFNDNKMYVKYIERIPLEELKITFSQPRNVGFKEMKHFEVMTECGLICFLDTLFAEMQSVKTYRSNYNDDGMKPLSEFFLNNLDADNFAKHLNLNKTEHRLIYILLNFIKFTYDPDNTESFMKAKKYLLEFPYSCRENCIDLIGMYDALYNYCIQQLISGNNEFRFELFEVCKKKLLLIKQFDLKGMIHWAMFRSIASNAIKIGETEWAEAFIKENIDKLPEDIRQEIYYYLFSLLELAKKNYEKALEHSSRININYHHSKVIVKYVSLICYYELELFEQSLSCLDSFKHFLSYSEQLEENVRSDYKQFIKLYSRMLQYRMNPETLNKKCIGEMADEAAKILSGKEWVSEKINEFASYYSAHKKKKERSVLKHA